MFALQSSDVALFIWCHCRGGVLLLMAFVVMFAYRSCLFVVAFVRPKCILVKCIGSALVFRFSPPRLVSVRS